MILIAGPCVLESEVELKYTAQMLKQFIGADFYLKASCIKDNRTTQSRFYGYGFEKCIPIFKYIKEQFGVKITTDFHTPEQIHQYGQHFDLIQIPAFLARQQGLLQAAAEMGKPVHVKKPQFINPADAHKIFTILREYGCKNEIFMSDRGTQFGYDTVMMDPRHVLAMRHEDMKVLVDITHPNKGRKNTTELAEILGKSYLAAGADGIFLEAHSCPEFALCDADTQIPLEKVPALIERLLKFKEMMV